MSQPSNLRRLHVATVRKQSAAVSREHEFFSSCFLTEYRFNLFLESLVYFKLKTFFNYLIEHYFMIEYINMSLCSKWYNCRIRIPSDKIITFKYFLTI